MKEGTERRLRASYPDAESDSIERTYAAMRYMLFLGDGGKRFRPALTMLACDACGGKESVAWVYAQAIEEIHTYTLIIDDIQDKSRVRRNAPSCHRRFDRNTAILAAERLYERGLLAFHQVSGPAADEPRKLLDQLHRGQAADLGAKRFKDRDLNVANLRFIHAGKTSSLIQLALLGGCMSAPTDVDRRAALLEYGYYLGMAFQARDDVLSAALGEEQIGKPAGESADLGRLTYVALLGSIEKAQSQAEDLATEACASLQKTGLGDASLLLEIAEYAVSRQR